MAARGGPQGRVGRGEVRVWGCLGAEDEALEVEGEIGLGRVLPHENLPPQLPLVLLDLQGGTRYVRAEGKGGTGGEVEGGRGGTVEGWA